MPHKILTRLAIPAPLIGITSAVHALTPPTTPVAPRYELVDALGELDLTADIADDPSRSRPALLYYDTTAANATTAQPTPVKRARYDRFAWVSSELGQLNRRDYTAGDENALRLVIDTSGAAHALAVEGNGAGAANDALIYFGQNAEGAVVREQIDVADIAQIALTVDSVAEPYVAYIKGAGTLVVRRRANGAWQQITLSPAPANAFNPAFAPYPAQANFFAMQLAWAENTASSSVLRHAVVSTLTGTSNVIVSSTTPNSLKTPQVVVDRFGTLEVAYVSSPNALPATVELRRRLSNQNTWDCIDTGCVLPTGPLLSGFALFPHAYVQGALSYRDADYTSRILRRQGAAWVSHALTDVATARGSAVNAFGNVHTMGIDRSSHRDLFAVRIGGPWEARGRIPLDTNIWLPRPLDVASDALGRPIFYGRRVPGAPDPRSALWMIGAGNDFIEHLMPGTFTAIDASIAVALDGVIHIALYDDTLDDLYHAEFTPSPSGGNWSLTRVDKQGDVGASPTMLIGRDGMPMTVYRGRPDLLQRAARAPDDNWTIRTLASRVLESAQPVAVTSREARILHVSWFHEESQTLRITTLHSDPRNLSFVPATDTVPTSAGCVRRRIHGIAMLGDGGVALAHSDEIPGQAQLGYRYRDYSGQWFDPGSQPQPFGSSGISRISLDSTLLAPEGARVSWIVGGRLQYAEKHSGLVQWQSEDLGPLASNAPLHLGAAGPLRITYGEGNGLFMLQRLEALGADTDMDMTGFLGRDPNGGVGYCAAVLLSPLFEDIGSSAGRTAIAAAGTAGTMGQGGSPSRGSLEVLADIRELFSTTATGRYYLALFAEHAAEIITLTLSDPALLVQRTRTLSDLLPGLSALVESPSRGHEFRFKPALIENARAVAEGWGDAGFPALAAAVAEELAHTDDFEQFVGMTFSEWFNAISVGNGVQQVFKDGFE